MKKIVASIITIGDELLIGQTIDTNSAYIARALNEMGIPLKRKISVGDDADDLVKALQDESQVSSVIIMTGGLGPTADDITKPVLCDYFGGKLIVNDDVAAHVKYLFEKVYQRSGPLLERNLKQAEVPDVCTVLHNARGTAPGMYFQKNEVHYFSLPGVPHEMKDLVKTKVIPVLREIFTIPPIIHMTGLTVGTGESSIAELLTDFEKNLPPSIRLAYLPDYGSVRLRLSAVENKEGVDEKLEQAFQEMKSLVNKWWVADTDIKLEQAIGEILKAKGKTMGTAESCTGGFMAHLITQHAGASAWFNGSVVSYSNEVKKNVLHVSEQTLEETGAVSEQTVIEMVKGGLEQLKTDYLVAVSGIMGPGGGSDEKPVGTVWIAAGNQQSIKTLSLQVKFDRERNIRITAQTALNFLRKFILTNS